jgi:phosphoribosylamine-glycine ligase
VKILVIGSGGREHAIAWACRRYGHDVDIAAGLPEPEMRQPDLVIPGPEHVLAGGVADECARRGVPCFGPTAELARLESSKGYARELAASLGIPGPVFARFEVGQADQAMNWADALGRAVVVKADGLAAGKGVVVPRNEGELLAAIGAAATGPFVLEERMTGPECSLVALCDGTTAVALPLDLDI